MLSPRSSTACAMLVLAFAIATPDSRAQGVASTPPASALATKPAVRQGGPSWSSLSADQQRALAPLKRDWPTIDPDRKQKWLEVVSRFPTMPEAERQRVQGRMAEWAQLTPSQRTQARLQFQEARQLSPEDRQTKWQAYQALSEQERLELAERARPAVAKSGAKPGGEPRPPAPSDSKRNIVQPERSASTKAVTPTVVQAKPGATTTLMSSTAKPPAHHQPGLPKIAATEGFVNPSTLLPQRGPQGAAVQLPNPPAAAASQ
jgi:Protein of unknown function (DUF3106)